MSESAGAVAASAVARQKVKQAQDACRRAARALAAAEDGHDVYVQRTCTTRQDVAEVTALAGLALAEHGRVDVVVLVAPAANGDIPRSR